MGASPDTEVVENTATVVTGATVFCLVPPELADELLDPLREHYASEPSVDVIVERRMGPRRSGLDRRALNLAVPPEVVARRSGRDRRSVADRRSPQIPRTITELPPELSAHAEKIRFVQRLPAVSRGTESLELARLIHAIQQGDPEAPTEFYWRMFERVYSRLRHLRGRYSNPDKHMPAVFGRLLDGIGDWDSRNGEPFHEWLYEIVDAFAAELPFEAPPETAAPPPRAVHPDTWPSGWPRRP